MRRVRCRRISATGRYVPSSNAAIRKKYQEDAKYRRKRIVHSRNYRAAHKEELAERQRRKWKAKQPACRARIFRQWHLQSKYGISLDDYDRLFKRQRGRCRICGVKKRKLYVDHKGKIVRGLLCHPCNCGLGFFRDDPKRMRRAIVYVKASSPPRRRRERRKKRRGR